jgi:hypothetical protein
MRFRLFSVFDVKAKAYLSPFACGEQGQAERLFADAINDREHMFGKHPEDYSLFEIADFDDSSGVVTPVAPTLVGQALQYVGTGEVVAFAAPGGDA